MATVDGRQGVWVLLIERGLDAGSDLRLFWHEVDAVGVAREYLSESYPAEKLATTADVLEAIEAENQIMSGEAYIVLSPVPVDGNQFFEGAVDQRPRCRACREPIELDGPDDPHRWVHCEDANYFGDHTADRKPPALSRRPRGRRGRRRRVARTRASR